MNETSLKGDRERRIFHVSSHERVEKITPDLRFVPVDPIGISLKVRWELE